MSSSRAWLLSYSRYATIWGHAQIRMGGGTKKKSLNISPIHEKESFILKFTSNGRKEKKRHRIFLRLGSWLVGYWVGAICIARRPAAAWDEGISTQSFFRRPVDSPALIFFDILQKVFLLKPTISIVSTTRRLKRQKHWLTIARRGHLLPLTISRARWMLLF